MEQLLESREANIHAELALLLESPEFSHSRMMRDFISYVCERRLLGATHIDQMEIAENVLNKGETFNPYEDASVRKLASLTRQRLHSYYERQESDRPVRIVLPPRTYAPEFVQTHVAGAQPSAPPEPEPITRRRWWVVAAASAVLLALAVGWIALRSDSTSQQAPMFTIRTQWGELWSTELDLADSAVLLGPALQPFDDAVVRMNFTPEQQYQQAGLMLWKDADHYVKLGRRFHTRTYLEFGLEKNASFQLLPENWHYDPFGQDGSPIWLRISRRGAKYNAYTSLDGFTWKPFGKSIDFDPLTSETHLALYGFNGRRKAAEAIANFRRVGVGLGDVPEFWHSAEREQAFLDTGWTNSTRCPENVSTSALEPVTETIPPLEDAPSAATLPCSFSLVQAPRETSWEISTRMDFLSEPGANAGLVVEGSKGRVRFVRYQSTTTTLSVIHEGHSMVSVPDHPGSPSIFLYLGVENGRLYARYSRDGRNLEEVPISLDASLLGDDIRAGAVYHKDPWMVDQKNPSPRFYSLLWMLRHPRHLSEMKK